MTRSLIIRFTVLSCVAAAYAENKADLVANYRIAAHYNAADKSLDGRETLTWTNSSTNDVPDLEFHLYMNAFKNEKSTFVRESGGQLRGDRLEKDKNPWGWIDVKRMSMSGADLTSTVAFIHPDDSNADDQTVVRVPLAKPLKPGETIELDIEFKTKFPKVFARTGYAGTFLLAGQWFPKIGVWEKGAWNCHQFHATSEFYADYGRYDVDLTVPSNEVIGATGELVKQVSAAGGGETTYTFHQENVHDFAWTIQPNYVKLERVFRAEREVNPQELQTVMKRHNVAIDEARLTDVKVTLLLQPEHASQAERHFKAAFNAIKWFGLWYGHYPHRTLTVVDPPANGAGAGGMEYPTFITAGTSWLTAANDGDPEGVLVHEFGHQFWQGQVGTNEFEAAWMDEGFNTYSTGKVIDLAYGRTRLPIRISGIPLGWFTSLPGFDSLEENRAAYLGIGPKLDDLSRFAWKYRSSSSYGENSYMRPALMLMTLENLLGSDEMERVMRTYQQRYRYRHPDAQDFIHTVEEVSGKDLTSYFQQTVFGSNVIDYKVDGVSSRLVKPYLGVFDKGGVKITVAPADVEKEEKAKKKGDSEYLNTVFIRREGEVVLPVEVRVTFKNGEIVSEKWDGAYRWVKYEYVRKSEVKQVEVDPSRKLVLDVNFSNNSWTSEPDESVVVKWGSTMLFWIQNILHIASVVG
ncbi:MAG TPA: M1 family metallopeptidase [Bryobacteraceae bacterium]|jgi:hypothetical protein